VNLAYFIAKRYFFSRKKKTFIHVISLISMLVVGVSTMALIIVLSVFNGLEGLLRNMYGSFEADVVVLPSEGKTFELSPELYETVSATAGVMSVADVIEDNVLVKYNNAQRVVTMKGVGEAFQTQGRFKDAITYGDMVLKKDSVAYALIGRGIQYDLSVNIQDDFHPLLIYYPKDLAPGQMNPERLFAQRPILVGGVFAVEKYFDERLLYVPVEFAQDLFQYTTERSALELKLDAGHNPEEVKSALQSALGPSFTIKLNEELHSSLYRILKWEKLFVFLTFGVILAIGSINIYFSLSMLVISKKKDWAVLKALGSPGELLRRIVLANGALIALGGAFSGLILGLLVCWLQQTFGWIGMGVPGAISDAYPVSIQALDVLATVLLVIVITVLSSIQPARKAANADDLNNLS